MGIIAERSKIQIIKSKEVKIKKRNTNQMKVE